MGYGVLVNRSYSLQLWCLTLGKEYDSTGDTLEHIYCVSLWRPNLTHMQPWPLQAEQVKQIRCLNNKDVTVSREFWCFLLRHHNRFFSAQNNLFQQIIVFSPNLASSCSHPDTGFKLFLFFLMMLLILCMLILILFRYYYWSLIFICFYPCLCLFLLLCRFFFFILSPSLRSPVCSHLFLWSTWLYFF